MLVLGTIILALKKLFQYNSVIQEMNRPLSLAPGLGAADFIIWLFLPSQKMLEMVNRVVLRTKSFTADLPSYGT